MFAPDDLPLAVDTTSTKLDAVIDPMCSSSLNCITSLFCISYDSNITINKRCMWFIITSIPRYHQTSLLNLHWFVDHQAIVVQSLTLNLKLLIIW